MASSITRTLPASYSFVPLPPPLDDYVNLRSVTGLTAKTAEQGSKALAGSWTSCHITYNSSHEPQVVGMGRIIGDGGWYFHVADMAVHPDHQKKGLGDYILAKLIEKVEQEAPDRPYINLIADPPGMRLYERHGFVKTSTVGRKSVGMQRY
jgi:GNAT superfamily N-acetyltransferase